MNQELIPLLVVIFVILLKYVAGPEISRRVWLAYFRQYARWKIRTVPALTPDEQDKAAKVFLREMYLEIGEIAGAKHRCSSALLKALTEIQAEKAVGCSQHVTTTSRITMIIPEPVDPDDPRLVGHRPTSLNGHTKP